MRHLVLPIPAPSESSHFGLLWGDFVLKGRQVLGILAEGDLNWSLYGKFWQTTSTWIQVLSLRIAIPKLCKNHMHYGKVSCQQYSEIAKSRPWSSSGRQELPVVANSQLSGSWRTLKLCVCGHQREAVPLGCKWLRYLLSRMPPWINCLVMAEIPEHIQVLQDRMISKMNAWREIAGQVTEKCTKELLAKYFETDKEYETAKNEWLTAVKGLNNLK